MASRRNVLQALGGAAALSLGVPVVRPSGAQPARIRAERLAGELHLLTVAGVNVVAFATADGLMLVDGGPAEHSDELLRAVAALPNGGPVQTLFNTHWHREQTGANERLGQSSATIIAQENTRLWLTTDVTWPWDGQTFEPLPRAAQPSKSFHDRDEVTLGVNRIVLGHLRHAAHTDGDGYAFFPNENVLAVGDAVTSAGWQEIDWWTGGWIGGVVGGLELLLSLTDEETRIAPARGAVMRRADLQRQFEMYSTIYERLSRLLNSGRSPREAVESKATVEFDAVMGNSDEFIVRAFESMWAYLSPDA